MNLTSAYIEVAVFAGAIALWGIYEYREREIRHKKSLLDLQKNIEPKMGKPPDWNRVGTTIATAVLLFFVIVAGGILVARIGFHYGSFIMEALVGFAILDLLLFMMAIRDSRTLRKG